MKKQIGFFVLAIFIGFLLSSIGILWAASSLPRTNQAGVHSMGQMFIGRWDDDATGNVLNIQDSSTQWTVPDLGDSYIIKATGNTVHVKCGSDPTAATDSRALILTDGEYSPRLYFDCVDANADNQCDARKCAYIGSATAGQIIFMRFQRDK